MGQHRSEVSRSLEWVQTEGEAGPLRVVKHACDVLAARVGHDQAVNIVTAVGAVGSGKSSLMNALTLNDGVFRVSAETQPCTSGADLGPIMMPLSDFERGESATSEPSTCESMIVFVDMEGQGDKSIDHDARLATPFLLVSKVVLFNWLGKPNRTTMLEKLHLMVSATNKDEREDTHIGWTDIFCQLVILVRDTSGPGKAEQIRKHLLDDEDIGLSRDRRSTTNRNTIRARLRSAFENVVVRTLPIPHPDITERETEMTASDFTPGFKAAVDGLRSEIVDMVKTPRKRGSSILGGETMANIMVRLCDVVNGEEGISAPRLVHTMESTGEIQKAAQGALALFLVDPHIEEMAECVFSSILAVERVEAARGSAMEMFQHAVKMIPPDIVQHELAKIQKDLEARSAATLRLQEEKRVDLNEKLEVAARYALTKVQEQARGVRLPVLDREQLKTIWDVIVNCSFAVYEEKHATLMPKQCRGDLQADLTWALTKRSFSRKSEGEFVRLTTRNEIAITELDEQPEPTDEPTPSGPQPTTRPLSPRALVEVTKDKTPKDGPGYVYMMHDPLVMDIWKVGQSERPDTLADRLKKLSRVYNTTLEFGKCWEVRWRKKVESVAHKDLKDMGLHYPIRKNSSGKTLDGGTEWYQGDEQVIKERVSLAATTVDREEKHAEDSSRAVGG